MLGEPRKRPGAGCERGGPNGCVRRSARRRSTLRARRRPGRSLDDEDRRRPIRAEGRAQGDRGPAMAFERPIQEIEAQLAELEALSLRTQPRHLERDRGRCASGSRRRSETTYADLSAWERVNVARHAERPVATRLHREDPRRLRRAARRQGLRRRQGDRHRPRRASRTAASCWSGTARGARPRSAWPATSAARTPRATARRCARCAWPRSSGCRSSCLINTPGAYPGIGAEERGQADGDRREHPRDDVAAQSPILVHRDRRGRLGRRARHRRRRPRAHDGVRLLLGDQPRGLRRDPVEGRRAHARTRPRRCKLTSPRPDAPRPDRRRHPRAPGRRPPRADGRHGARSSARSCASSTCSPSATRGGWWPSGARSSARWACSRGASRAPSPSEPRGGFWPLSPEDPPRPRHHAPVRPVREPEDLSGYAGDASLRDRILTGDRAAAQAFLEGAPRAALRVLPLPPGGRAQPGRGRGPGHAAHGPRGPLGLRRALEPAHLALRDRQEQDPRPAPPAPPAGAARTFWPRRRGRSTRSSRASSPRPLPDWILEQRETRELVGATLSSLSPDYRRALTREVRRRRLRARHGARQRPQREGDGVAR